MAKRIYFNAGGYLHHFMNCRLWICTKVSTLLPFFVVVLGVLSSQIQAQHVGKKSQLSEENAFPKPTFTTSKNRPEKQKEARSKEVRGVASNGIAKEKEKIVKWIQRLKKEIEAKLQVLDLKM